MVLVPRFKSKPIAPTEGGSSHPIGQRTPRLPFEFQPFDYAVIRFAWAAEDGTDLDTRTAVISPNRGTDVGWNRGSSDESYLAWGGDNTTSDGPEAVLVNFLSLVTDYPGQAVFDLRLRAFWYSSRGDGNLTIQFETYLGGTMSPDGFDFVNTGGVVVQNISHNRNAATQISSDIDGDDMAVLRYTASTKTAEII